MTEPARAQVIRRNMPWVVYRFVPESFGCIRCDARVLFPLPKTIDVFVHAFRNFAQHHLDCGGNKNEN